MSAPEPSAWSGLEVAIVGWSGRFPGAASVDELWRRLRAGEECITFRTEEELLAAGVDPELLRDPRYVRAAAVVDGIEEFDAAFFGLTPREAETMDPQHRFFLECAWEALEHAGYDPARVPGAVGVYGGASTNTYLTHNLLRNASVDAGGLPALFGNDSDYLTTRVSYKLDLTGPSLDVQTGCSSSLVAVHLACQALIAGECDLALAGGVSISVPSGLGYLYQDAGIYSPDGHCRAFSSKAEGTAGGSGVAVVTLRRLEDALAAGDTILGVIRGSAINNDGSDKVGYAAPGVDGQTAVIRAAMTMAEVEPDSITYVETHGTGTSLGDPIEVKALTRAFRTGPEGRGTQRNGYCAIGSIKTNIGHLDAAAGVTGLIKATLALQHRELPPSLNCDEPNPEIGFESTPFHVNTRLTPWECDGPRRAGVSSFGIGGTNAHVVLEEAPAPAAATPPMDAGPPVRERLLLPLSARSAAALDRMGERLAEHLEAHPALDLASVAGTLQRGRHDFEHRRVFAARERDALIADLRSGAALQGLVQEAGQRPCAFLFPGQGAQHVGMLAGVYAGEPVFREALDRSCERLAPHLGLDLRELIHAEASDEAAERLRETRLTQPALFVVEHALAQLWRSWGVEPAAMIGHSIGEYVAATLAGVFSLEDALALVAERGRLMQELPAGDMLAVPLPAAEVEPLLDEATSIAAVNEASSCVVSGNAEAVAAVAKRLAAERGVEGRVLHTSHAFHSPMMDPILAPFTERVASVALHPPQLPYLSNVSGTWIRPEEATDPAYWARHLRGAVRFEAGVRELLADPQRVLLEVGPGNTLTTLSRRIARGMDRTDGAAGAPTVIAPSARHPNEERDDADVLQDALATLWLARVPVDWDAYYGEALPRRVPLPTYPFERKRYWIEPDEDAGDRAAERPGKRARIADWFFVPGWERTPPSLARRPEIEARELLVMGPADLPLTEAVAAELRALGKGVTLVREGSAFVAEERSFAIDVAEEDHYRRLFRELETRGRIPGAVVHLFASTPLGDPTTGEANEADEELCRGAMSLLAIAKAVDGIEGWTHPLEILAVTRGVHAVLGDEALEPERATVLGACQAITQECPRFTCRSLDLAGEDGPDTARGIVRELARGDEAPALPAALRGRHRWRADYAQVEVPAPDAAPSAPTDGYHLVTGGLGSIGLEVAATLARAGRRRLVLTGRSAFPERDAWDALLAERDAQDETRRRVEVLRALESEGTEIELAQVDVTDLAAMQALLARCDERFGALRGVVHAAGAEKVMARLQETSLADMQRQLAPKRAGLAVLEQVLEGRELEECIVLSSLASVLGALGMVGYVAAHHWVDAFVARHNARSDQPWTRASWDNWLSWKEREFLHGDGPDAYYMTPEEGGEAFRRVLALPAGTAVVLSTGSLAARLEAWLGGGDDAPAETTAALHERPDLRSEYVAPATAVEEAIARAWGEVLGIARIGTADSFFELGGDSVLGLSIVAKLGQAGLKITPAQIFEHPTIAGLAGVAQVRERSGEPHGAEAAEERVEGEVPLTPVQHWFFEQEVPTPAHFNLPMLFDVPADSRSEHVRAALADVAAHHDALRLRFRRQDGNVVQAYAPEDAAGAVELTEVALGDLAEAERVAAMRRAADEAHVTLDLEHGPLARAILFRMGTGEPAQLLWIVHHLVVDLVAWRVLIEDLRSALEARGRGATPALPRKTCSLKRWSERLTAAAQERDPAPWLAQGNVPPLPTDLDEGPNRFADARKVTTALDEARTRALLTEVPPVYGTQIEDVLLCALARAFHAWTGARELLVDLEGHGREDVGGELDLSRTVGWFTTIFPVRLALPESEAPSEHLKTIKETVRAATKRGIEYGMLRYLHRDEEVRRRLAALPRPEVNFLYLGQFDTLAGSLPVRLLEEASGAPCSPDLERNHLLEVAAFVQDGRLRVEWSYASGRHRADTVERLARGYLTELEALIAHCQDPEAGGRTVSDFPGAKVSQKSLDKLLSKIGKGGKKPRAT